MQKPPLYKNQHKSQDYQDIRVEITYEDLKKY
jgi:hypothetical protein